MYSPIKYNFDDKSDKEKSADVTLTQKALTHLITVTSNELDETNKNLEKIIAKKTAQLQKKIEELEYTSKVKSEFLATMSHEIRTPLNAILGFSKLLKEDEKSEDKKKKFNIIESSGNSLLALINDILDFSKIENGRVEVEQVVFMTKEPFKEVITMFEHSAQEKKISLHNTFSKNIPKYFIGDVNRIKQIAVNFISNAMKFTDSYGSVAADLSFDEKKQILKFNVIDTGVGIDANNLGKVFQSFTQEDNSTTRRFGGTGLGLSISKALVEIMGGEIAVESKRGEGSIFSFTLPASEITDECVVSSTNTLSVDLEKKIYSKVLLVEDNKTNQLLIDAILNDLELEIDVVENGQEAVSMFEKNDYDIILMDENMPVMSGMEAIKIILELERDKGLKHTPIVALTVNALSTDRERFLNAGMDEFVPKPIYSDLLISILHKFLIS
ncbi:MAG: response regulator [Sulfurimonas sp.]|nr:response regulator [Sulfurimonas sp.]